MSNPQTMRAAADVKIELVSGGKCVKDVVLSAVSCVLTQQPEQKRCVVPVLRLSAFCFQTQNKLAVFG